MALVQTILQCACCEASVDEVALFTCTKKDCTKQGEFYCEECGPTTHKRKNHAFDVNQPYIKQIDRNQIQQDISVCNIFPDDFV